MRQAEAREQSEAANSNPSQTIVDAINLQKTQLTVTIAVATIFIVLLLILSQPLSQPKVTISDSLTATAPSSSALVEIKDDIPFEATLEPTKPLQVTVPKGRSLRVQAARGLETYVQTPVVVKTEGGVGIWEIRSTIESPVRIRITLR
ncbi:MAG: hypothetical protein AAB589_01925 [Patescibacteria group bacterium]